MLNPTATDADPSTTCKVMVLSSRMTSRRMAGLTRWLPDDAGFALDLGFVPLEGGPGETVAALVLGASPAGQAAVSTRLVGALQADQTHGGATVRNDCVIAVAHDADQFAQVREVEDLDEAVLTHLTRAWEAYNIARYAAFQVVAVDGAAEALRLLSRRLDRSSGSKAPGAGKQAAPIAW